MTELSLLAADVGTHERTLRRAAGRGTIRCRRTGPRRLFLPAGEYEYVLAHWPLIGRLVQGLRTLPNVRLAVLYGSVARGDESAASDVDVLISFRRDGVHARALAGERLEEAAGRPVQLVSLGEAPPLLLGDALRDGRVLVDRDGDWPRLKAREARVQRRARAAERDLEREAWASLRDLGVVA